MIAATGSERPAHNPLHAILLCFPIALFTSALISDIAYLRTAEMQWSNFSAWLIVGALVFGGVAGQGGDDRARAQVSLLSPEAAGVRRRPR